MRDTKIVGRPSPSEFKMLVCCHKPCELPESEYFLPVHVGAAVSEHDLGIQRDDQVWGEPCDNISAKNPHYCEVTAVYWAWKNIKALHPDLRYIGLSHYRRYFAFDKHTTQHDLYKLPEREVMSYRFDVDACIRLLSSGRVVCSKRKLYPYPLTVDYAKCHVSEDLRTLREVVRDVCPEYDDAFVDTLACNNAISHFNMFVMPWGLFDRYCQWLFPVLFETERRLHIQYYSPLQGRVLGFMAERLENVWLKKHDVPLAQVPVYKYMGESPRQFSTLVKAALNVRAMVGFACTRPIEKKDAFFTE